MNDLQTLTRALQAALVLQEYLHRQPTAIHLGQTFERRLDGAIVQLCALVANKVEERSNG